MDKNQKQKPSRWQKFKRFLKKNMTPTWAKRFSYQVVAFLISVSMVVGVSIYAFNKSYDERRLTFVDGFTITAHTGAFNTPDNSLESVKAAISNNAKVLEVDLRLRPDGTVVMGHDLITTNSDGVELSTVFALIKRSDTMLNLDIKETRVLAPLYDLIVEYSMMDKVFLTGIETFQVKKVMKKCPGVPYYINYIPSRIKIFSQDYQKKLIELMEETGAVGINCMHSHASVTLSNLLHNNGYKLSVWTVDKKWQMKRALVNKPDNITSHKPDLLQEVIDNWGK